MQWQKRLQDTHLHCHKNLDLSGQEASDKYRSSLQNLLYNAGVDNLSQNYAGTSSFSKSEVSNSSLADSLSPGRICRSGSVKELLGIICSPDFDFLLFSTEFTASRWGHEICKRIVKNFKYSWPTSILPKRYYHVYTLSAVVTISNDFFS